ncbi:DgyrCDS8595, partial [Dimorphilus gyrociliatus]
MFTLKELCFQKIAESRDRLFQRRTGVVKLPPSIVEQLLCYLDNEETGISPYYLNFCLRYKLNIKNVKINGFRIRNDVDLMFLTNPYLESCEIRNLEFHQFNKIFSVINKQNLKKLRLTEASFLKRNLPVNPRINPIKWTKFKNLISLKLEYKFSEIEILGNLCIELINLEELDLICPETNFFPLKNLLKLKRLRIKNTKNLVLPHTIICLEKLKLLEHLELRFSLALSFPDYDTERIFKVATWPNLMYYAHFRNTFAKLDLIENFISRHPKLNYLDVECDRQYMQDLEDIASSHSTSLLVENKYSTLYVDKYKLMIEYLEVEDVKKFLYSYFRFFSEREISLLDEWECIKYFEIIVDILKENKGRIYYDYSNYNETFVDIINHFLRVEHFCRDMKIKRTIFKICYDSFFHPDLYDC